MFPTSINGSIEAQGSGSVSVEELLSSIESGLVNAEARDIRRVGNKLAFRGGIFRLVSNWNVLGPVGSGEIEVIPGTPAEVRYHFSCVEGLVIVTVMAVMVGAAIISANPSETSSYVIPVILWLWLFGMNYLVALVRLPAFMRRTVDA